MFDEPYISVRGKLVFTKDDINELCYLLCEYDEMIQFYTNRPHDTFKKIPFWQKVDRRYAKYLHGEMYKLILPVVKWVIRNDYKTFEPYINEVFSELFSIMTYYGFRKLYWYVCILADKYGNGIKSERIIRNVKDWTYRTLWCLQAEDKKFDRWHYKAALKQVDDLQDRHYSAEDKVITQEIRREFVAYMVTPPATLRIPIYRYLMLAKHYLRRLLGASSTVPYEKFEYDYVVYNIRRKMKESRITIDDLSEFENLEPTIPELIEEEVNKICATVLIIKPKRISPSKRKLLIQECMMK